MQVSKYELTCKVNCKVIRSILSIYSSIFLLKRKTKASISSQISFTTKKTKVKIQLTEHNSIKETDYVFYMPDWVSII